MTVDKMKFIPYSLYVDAFRNWAIDLFFSLAYFNLWTLFIACLFQPR